MSEVAKRFSVENLLLMFLRVIEKGKQTFALIHFVPGANIKINTKNAAGGDIIHLVIR